MYTPSQPSSPLVEKVARAAAAARQVQPTSTSPPSDDSIAQDQTHVTVPIISTASEEAELVAAFGEVDKDAYEMLGYEDDEDDVDEEDIDLDDDEQFQKFKTKTRQDAAHASEAQRRQGGVKTQNACVRDGNQTGKKPPLRLVHQYFGSEWRALPNESVCVYLCSFVCLTIVIGAPDSGQVMAAFPRNPRMDRLSIF